MSKGNQLAAGVAGLAVGGLAGHTIGKDKGKRIGFEHGYHFKEDDAASHEKKAFWKGFEKRAGLFSHDVVEGFDKKSPGAVARVKKGFTKKTVFPVYHEGKNKSVAGFALVDDQGRVRHGEYGDGPIRKKLLGDKEFQKHYEAFKAHNRARDGFED